MDSSSPQRLDRADLLRQCEQVLAGLPPGSVVCGLTVFDLIGVELSDTLRAAVDQGIHIAVPRGSLSRSTESFTLHRPRRKALAWRRIGSALIAHPAFCWLQLVDQTLTRPGLGADTGFRLDPTLVPEAWALRADRKGMGHSIIPTRPGVFTSPARERFVDLVQLVDQLLCRKRPVLTYQDCVEQLSERSDASGVQVARLVFSHARPGTDSPPETRLRLTLVDGGYPVPAVSFPITDTSGRLIRLADLAYSIERVDLEYQGKYHFEGPAAVHRDRERRQDLDRLGWQLIEVVWSDFDNPSVIYQRLDTAIARSRKLGT